MMKYLFIFLLVLPLKGFNQESRLSHNDGPDVQEKLSRFLEIADSLKVLSNTPGAGFAIVYDAKPLFQGGIGFRDVENQLPVTENTLFAIGSCSKAFTGVLAARLVDEDKISWERPIKEYLPSFKLTDSYASQHTNLIDCFTHRVGVSRNDKIWLSNPTLSRKELLEKVALEKFDFSFRERASYNNVMVLAAGVVEEVQGGKRWEELIHSEVFQPLEMHNSTATYEEFMKYQEKSIGYKPNGKKHIAHRNIDVVAPAGGIGSTPKDLTNWLLMFVNEGKHQGDSFLSNHQYTFITSPHAINDYEFPSFWGIGWAIVYVNGQKILNHDGGIDGQNAFALIFPDQGFGIFIMTNHRSMYKNLMAEYAENIFLKNQFQRDYEKEKEFLSMKP
ncbi:MAG: serine hydrolase domain-containing protein [Bacteroidota bacterium]